MAVVLPPVAVAFARWGIPPLDVMWPMHRLGIVGPSCGLTRAVVALARGEPGRAWQFNPSGFVVAAAVVTLVARALVAVVSGRWFEPVLRVRRTGAVAVAATVALWANQQAHAQFLLHHLR